MDTPLDGKELLSLIQNPIFLLIGAWVMREFWTLSQKKASGYDDALKANNAKLTELTIAIVKLETRLESVDKALEILPKMRADIDASHSKIRDLATNA